MATTKELAPSPSVLDETPASQNVGGQTASRADAIAIEIPVVVHASRRSVDQGKAVPPLHEKTHTAIVFPKGGVVRLAANLSVGALVVLTNQQSGADVLCRVSSVKAHPGSQNYVGLEFTQSAPEFWRQGFVAKSPGQIEELSSKPRPPIPAADPFTPVPVKQPASLAPFEAEPASPVSTAPPDPVLFTIPVNAPSVQSSETHRMDAVAPPSLANTSGITPGLAESRDEGQRVAATSEAPMPSPALKKGLWILASAVVVVALTIGGFLIGRHGRSTSPVAQVAVASPTASMQPFAVTPAVTQSIEPTAESAGSTVLSATSQQSSALEGIEQQRESPTQRSSRGADAGKLARPLRNPQAKIDSSEPPQMPQTRGYSSTENVLGAGSLSGAAEVPAPPTSAATANSTTRASGQLQAPQLIYSPPLIYPSSARQANIEGVVVMDALVDGTGKVSDVSVVSGPIALQQAAIETVRAFKYQPARMDGRPIAEHVKVNLDFALNGPAAPASPVLKTQPAATQIPSVAPLTSAPNAAPKLISSPPPTYPPAARAGGIEGTIIVDILVDANGKVAQAKAISGPVQLQPAAMEAVRYWKYQAARSDGQPIAQHMQVSINFRLR